ncbi:MAG: hypothetical protein LJE62_07575 [Silicimonas sp.]|nr:hypothetical protein [Silicimonas sp.]
MIYLLGPVTSVDAQLDMAKLPAGLTDVSFTIRLQHENGAHSHVSACKLNYIDDRELRVLGSKGSYVSKTIDIQAQDIFAGKRPIDDLAGWGFEPEANWSTLRNSSGTEVVPSEQERYHDYYAAFARSVRDGIAPPVSAEQGAMTLAVLDAARRKRGRGAADHSLTFGPQAQVQGKRTC